jgi:hypothetical protein
MTQGLQERQAIRLDDEAITWGAPTRAAQRPRLGAIACPQTLPPDNR